MGIKFFDYDNDGRPDLFVTDMHSDMSEEVGPEREKLKSRMEWTDGLPAGRRRPSSSSATRSSTTSATAGSRRSPTALGVENYWPWGPSVGDLNADGWQDIFIASSMNFPFRYGINSLLLNNRGEKFLDSEFLLGIEPRRGGRTHTPWFDVDCSAPAWPAQQGSARDRPGKITVMAPLGTPLVGDASISTATATSTSSPTTSTRSRRCSSATWPQRRPVHWLEVALAGTASNRDGLGASGARARRAAAC